jgi:predicted urease superfamily metal-dependent hydrolase
VTIARGDFTRIKITVARHGVDFHRVVVHFANGGDQEVEMRATIPAGGETRAIDLRAGERVIRSVEFWYDARTIRGRRAVVRLFGLP